MISNIYRRIFPARHEREISHLVVYGLSVFQVRLGVLSLEKL